jgi:hypothetical protein
MTTNTTVYAPVHMLPERGHLERLAPGATIERDAEAAGIILSWPDLRVILSRMPDAAMGRHLHWLQGFVRSKGGGEALATRTLSVDGFVVEPQFDREGRAMRLVDGLTAATDGLCLLGDGKLYDAAGRELLDGLPVLGPPAADRVAARALVLLALSMRGLLDEDAGKPDEGQPKALKSCFSLLERAPFRRMTTRNTRTRSQARSGGLCATPPALLDGPRLASLAITDSGNVYKADQEAAAHRWPVRCCNW